MYNSRVPCFREKRRTNGTRTVTKVDLHPRQAQAPRASVRKDVAVAQPYNLRSFYAESHVCIHEIRVCRVTSRGPSDRYRRPGGRSQLQDLRWRVARSCRWRKTLKTFRMRNELVYLLIKFITTVCNYVHTVCLCRYRYAGGCANSNDPSTDAPHLWITPPLEEEERISDKKQQQREKFTKATTDRVERKQCPC